MERSLLAKATRYALLIAALTLVGRAPAWASSPTLIAQPGVAAPGSIYELARALKNDVFLIHEYVYTNIDYSPTYGLKKGALGTLLDGRGNDFDQSALMVALLRQSGYTANYIYGQIRLTPSQLSNWLGVTTTGPCPVSLLLTHGGIPHFAAVTGSPDCSGTLVYADIAHTWVSVTGGSLGTNTYVFDPSFKTYTALSNAINLATVLGYDRTSFLSLSGGTTGTSSIQNVNRANLRGALANYTNNLLAYIKTNTPTATTKEVIGGKYIQPIVQPYSPVTSLSYETPGDTPQVWTGQIPNQYRTTMQLQIGGINQTYYSDEIYGHRLSLVYNASAQPVLYLDGISQGAGTANAISLSLDVTFPFCFATTGSTAPSCPSGFTNVFSRNNTLQAGDGYTFAIVNSWDHAGRGMLEFHRRQLQANRASGAADGSEAVLGETLNTIGYSWLAQAAGAADLGDHIIGSKTVFHCAIGVVGQVTAPYIDIPGIFAGISSLTDDANRPITALFTYGGHASALEWGALDQNLSKSGSSAVSTIKLLDIANDQGDVIYDATSSNWATIQGLLTNYASSDLNTIQNTYINNGFRVILPQHGNLTQGGWTGASYLAITSGKISYLISPNLKGGYFDNPILPSTYVPFVETTWPPVLPPPAAVSLEPIDLSSGAYLYDQTDLSIGSSAFPVGLSFQRSYNSNNRYDKGSLGLGWTHNFAINAAVNSDGLKGMGQDSPVDGAAAIVAAYVAQDLLSDAAKPLKNLVVASLTQRWFMDQLINNTVNITTGAQSEQFMLLADGSYNPRLGSSNRLDLTAGQYTLRYKDGTKLDFNSAGNISNWQNPAGGALSFTYNAASPPQLTSISNNLGRSFTLTYDGSNRISSVSDNASPSRNVSYGYSSTGDLSSFTNPIGNVTNFVYGSPGLLAKIFNPSDPSTPFVSNTYDSLGRVSAQANGNNSELNNTTWSYFFAGYRSEEVDPLGTQHVLYYNPRGKVVFDIQDFAGLDLVTANLYDGLDRTTSTTQPEGNSTTSAYDSVVNPWANNPSSVTRNPKPGSPLSALVTAYSYDPRFNKPVSLTDPRGLITTKGYDLGGNLISTIVDAGSASHFNARSSFTYNDTGQVLTATDPTGTRTKFAYDDFGNLTSTTRDAGSNGLNQITSSAYTSVGDVAITTDPNGNITLRTYDAARQLLTATSPASAAASSGVVTALSYDPDGRVLQTRQSTGGAVLRATISTYTPTGKPATATDANGNVTRFSYDLLDRLAATTDAIGRVTINSYDALGRRTGVLNTAVQASFLVQQTYTENGRLATLTDANGNVTSFAYDGFDRLATTTYPGGSTETFTYDEDDNVLTRKTRANQTLTFTYDTLNRPATKTPPSPAPVVSYGYDLAGRMTATSDTSATIAAAVPPTGNSVQYAATYAYDALNRPVGVTWDSAPAVTLPSGMSVTFGHSYNKANQRSGQTTTDNTWWSYPAATPNSVSYTANTLNQYTAVGAATPTYDGNGNLTGDGIFTFGYDAENRLVSASGAGNTASYAFDAQGRRKSKTVNGTTTQFVTDADNREMLEYDGSSGAILSWYAYGLGPNAVLNQMNVAAMTRATFIPDIQGSIIGSVDGSGALAKIGYAPYGKSASTGPFAYTGQRIDPETAGLHYYRARMYAAAWGRFSQPDPLGYPSGANLYAYVQNDPLNFVDPNGLAAAGFSAGFGASFLGNDNIFFNNILTASTPAQIGAGLGFAAGLVLNRAAEILPFVIGSAAFGGGVQAAQTIDANKLNHIFQPTHNLQPLVQQYGSEAGAYRAVDQAVTSQLSTGTGTYSTVVNVGGTNVTVTGAYVNGVPRIGTFFIP